MISNYFNQDFDEIFDNDTIDINNDLLNDEHLLWNNDCMNLISNDFNFDQLNDDNLYDNLMEKSKNKQINDFDSFDFNYLSNDSSENQQIKLEPTNSVSSTYLTDESSHPSSINSSPISGKIRKRNHATLDSSSETSFAFQDEFLDPPTKTTKVEYIKTTIPSTKIYKFTKDIKSEPIYVNSLTIRQGNNNVPYVVHKVPGGIKTVNIRPQKYVTERQNEPTVNNFIRPSQQSITEEDKEYQSGDYYDNEIDHYSDYRTRTNCYSNEVTYNGINQNHINNNKTVFQPIPQSGPLHLTEEEKRTLLAEGYSIPTRLPLTKQDERNLKKVRRKIKNKISAQESRRKKKEYLDALEKKLEAYELEMAEDKRRIELLQNTQRSLYSQIRHLQQQLMNISPGAATSTGLMLFMLCFAVFLGGSILPSSYYHINVPQSPPMSSSLLYNMGYGISRGGLNHSDYNTMFKDNAFYKKDNANFRSFGDDGIIPRRSILLDDDVFDERHFDEIALSFIKSKPMCEKDPRTLTRNGHSIFKNKTIYKAKPIMVMSFISTST